MNKHYDFSKGKRGAAIPPPAGKTRVTIYLDDAVVKHFKRRSSREGKGYQSLINDALMSATGAPAAVTLSISSREDINRRVRAAFRGEKQGVHISFASVELLSDWLARNKPVLQGIRRAKKQKARP
jgi:hypothetical protein